MKKLLLTLFSIGMIGMAQAQNNLPSILLKKHESEKVAMYLSISGSIINVLSLTAAPISIVGCIWGTGLQVGGVVTWIKGRVNYKKELELYLKENK